MSPVIGLPMCLDTRARWKPGRDYHYVDRAYTRAIEAAGGTTLMLPVQRDAAALLDRIDGLLIPGGDDFLPATPYAQPVEFDPTPDEQLVFDRALLAGALERGLPFLGVCYGAQLLALEHGGTLHHHLPVDVPDASDHRLPEQSGRHVVHVHPETTLAALVGTDEIHVNSLHHQAVAEPGEGLRQAAVAADGVIEGIEAADGRLVLGVQWHPERLAGAAGQGLIEAFVAAAARE